MASATCGAAMHAAGARSAIVRATIGLARELADALCDAVRRIDPLIDPAPFLPPFLILCALTLFFSVIGPLGAAMALKWSGD